MVKRSILLILLGVIGLMLAPLSADTISQENQASFPTGYRHWFHVKSGTIDNDHPVFASSAGIHHIYANSLALEGLKTGIYKHGAVFVADFFELQAKDKLGVVGKRKRIDVMQYDEHSFEATNKWGYASFESGMQTKRVLQNTITSCHSCHKAAEDTGFIFSQYRR